MSGRVILGDIIMGVVLGFAVYFVTTTMWPVLSGASFMVLSVSGATIVALFREPGGSLYTPGAAPFIEKGQRVVRRASSADLASITMSPLLIKAFCGWLLGGIVLAILVPLLKTRGVELRQWIAWLVMLGAFALFCGPDLAARFSGRRR